MIVKRDDFLSIELGYSYTKDQLYKIFESKDLSNIKRKLKSLGYEFTTNNRRGDNYRLTIINKVVTSVDKIVNFRDYCINELNAVNIDYYKFA